MARSLTIRPLSLLPPLPYPRLRLPHVDYQDYITDSVNQRWEWVPLDDDENAEGWADWHDHPDFVPFYDDPEFTGFASGRKLLTGFRSAKHILHSYLDSDGRDLFNTPDQHTDVSDLEDLYGEQLQLNNSEPVMLHLYLLTLQMHADLSDLEDLYGEQLPLNNAEPVMLHPYLLTLQMHADLSNLEDLYGEQLPLNNAELVILHLY